MTIYVLTFLFTIALAWLGTHMQSYRHGKKLWVIIISALPLFLLSGLRYGIGTDFASYEDIYIQYTSKGQRGKYEPLFYLIGRILSLFKADPQWLFVVCAAIYIFFIFVSIYNNSPYPLLSIFLLFGLTYYFLSFNAVRQGLGCAILLYSLKYVESKNFIKFLFCILAAGGMHYSCLIFVIVYFMSGIRFTVLKTISTLCILIASQGIVTLVINLLFKNTKYAVYLVETTFNILSLPGMAIQVAILVLAIAAYKPSLMYNACCGAQLFATWVTIMGNAIPLSVRIKWIFGVPAILLIPMAISNIKSASMRAFITIGVVVCFSIYAYITVGLLGSQAVIPYRSIFSK